MKVLNTLNWKGVGSILLNKCPAFVYFEWLVSSYWYYCGKQSAWTTVELGSLQQLPSQLHHNC